jgi:hypothetical protein
MDRNTEEYSQPLRQQRYDMNWDIDQQIAQKSKVERAITGKAIWGSGKFPVRRVEWSPPQA